MRRERFSRRRVGTVSGKPLATQFSRRSSRLRFVIKEKDKKGVIILSSGSVERKHQSRDLEGCTYQSSDPEEYTYQSSDPEGYTYQSSDPEGYTYQSSDPEGCTYQSSDPEGYTYQ
ncbi:NBS-LRR type resistance protein [Cucumis melo var. makuwa]|uniref:NBS-LRR type resistance protein n=1 Tax=Cucumis melo var. makuwa TaxID=1194695 RepID=A0A5A7T418_CUCMM|nr:NBS-LRR type resistance protein [Cucumis melo var. makuwa]